MCTGLPGQPQSPGDRPPRSVAPAAFRFDCPKVGNFGHIHKSRSLFLQSGPVNIAERRNFTLKKVKLTRFFILFATFALLLRLISALLHKPTNRKHTR